MYSAEETYQLDEDELRNPKRLRDHIVLTRTGQVGTHHLRHVARPVRMLCDSRGIS